MLDELNASVEILAVVDSFDTVEARVASRPPRSCSQAGGTARLSAQGLDAAPSLRAVIHAGGGALAAVDEEAARERT